ncbi:MAG TPA: peptidoglycan DD-metalloendopeptidase family protein [Candidatus Obscuribacterales bacterium]
MKRKTRSAASLLALTLISLSFALGPVRDGAAAPSKAQMPQVRRDMSKLKSNEDRIKAAHAKAQQLKKKEAKSIATIAEIQQDLEKASRQLDASNRRYEAAHREVEEITHQLISTEGNWEDTLDHAQQRLRKMYMFRQYAQTNQLMESENMATLVRRVGYFRYLARQDEHMLNDISLQKEKLSRLQYQQMLKRQVLGKQAHEQAEAKQKHSLEKKREAEYLRRLKYDRQFYEREERALEAESRAIAARLQSLFARQRTSNTYNIPLGTGRFIHPVVGPMTSPFGWRVHPIFGSRRMHTGQDFGVPAGTPIRAADSGVVIEAGWLGGYGKAIMIDHGRGIVTLYGHTSAFYVSSGQRVQKGQIIAAVGSTGNSTGPHLHLEVRVNGNPVNPLGYF